MIYQSKVTKISIELFVRLFCLALVDNVIVVKFYSRRSKYKYINGKSINKPMNYLICKFNLIKNLNIFKCQL